jgi:type VI protein secretion system component Hcp
MFRRAVSLLRRSPALAALVGVLVLAMTGFAVAAAGSDSTIQACVKNESGALRVVSSAQDCLKSEHAISFGQQGPVGPAGKDAPAAAPPHQAVVGTATLHGTSGDDITFDVLGVDFSAKNGEGTASGGAGAGKVTFAPITLVKHIDSSSPALAGLATRGLASDTLTVNLEKPGAASPYRRYTASDVFVSSVQQDAPDAGGRPVETVTFDAGSYDVQAPSDPPAPSDDAIGRISFTDGTTTIGPVPVYGSSFGVTASASSGNQSGGAGAGKATFSDFSVRKSLDAASGPLLAATLGGTHWRSAKLELFDSAGSTAVRHTYDLSDVSVVSFRDKATGQTSTSSVQEDVVLRASGYAQTDGGNTTCWNVATNAGC